MNPMETSLINAEKALKFSWKIVPGWCRSEDPPKNVPVCKTPMKAACCCACPNDKKLECMTSCLDSAGYDDMDDANQKLYMAYCGFACQGVSFYYVFMLDFLSHTK
jgi:hypothetical protein